MNDRRGGGGDFVAGFLVGSALFGTLAYIFAPQIRRSLLNEDEYGFRRARRPIYYDEGLEKTRQTLNAKISQLNSAIDNVSSRLRGGNNMPAVPIASDPEEATIYSGVQMNPIGKVPVLETPDGPIFESNAIARYVARLKSDNPLCGFSLTECAHVEQWIDFASLEVDANILNWFRPRMGHTVYLPPAEEAAISALKRGLGALNTYLASNTYLVGHAVTLADIIMTCNLYLGFTRLMTTSFTSEFPHVERYFWTMVNQANFSKILGEVKQTEKVPPVQSTKQPSPPKEAAKPKPKDEPKKEAKKEPAKPKEEAGEEEEKAPAPTCTLIFSPSR
ncbi:unnamed protein product [Camellia sinensis]